MITYILKGLSCLLPARHTGRRVDACNELYVTPRQLLLRDILYCRCHKKKKKKKKKKKGERERDIHGHRLQEEVIKFFLEILLEPDTSSFTA